MIELEEVKKRKEYAERKVKERHAMLRKEAEERRKMTVEHREKVQTQLRREQELLQKRMQQLSEDEERKKLTLARQHEATSRIAAATRSPKSFAFGSSTPRTLAYLNNLPKSEQLYDKKLKPLDTNSSISSSVSTTPSRSARPFIPSQRAPPAAHKPAPAMSSMTSSMYVTSSAPTTRTSKSLVKPHVTNTSPRRALPFASMMTQSVYTPSNRAVQSKSNNVGSNRGTPTSRGKTPPVSNSITARRPADSRKPPIPRRKQLSPKSQEKTPEKSIQKEVETPIVVEQPNLAVVDESFEQKKETENVESSENTQIETKVLEEETTRSVDVPEEIHEENEELQEKEDGLGQKEKEFKTLEEICEKREEMKEVDSEGERREEEKEETKVDDQEEHNDVNTGGDVAVVEEIHENYEKFSNNDVEEHEKEKEEEEEEEEKATVVEENFAIIEENEKNVTESNNVDSSIIDEHSHASLIDTSCESSTLVADNNIGENEKPTGNATSDLVDVFGNDFIVSDEPQRVVVFDEDADSGKASPTSSETSSTIDEVTPRIIAEKETPRVLPVSKSTEDIEKKEREAKEAEERRARLAAILAKSRGMPIPSAAALPGAVQKDDSPQSPATPKSPPAIPPQQLPLNLPNVNQEVTRTPTNESGGSADVLARLAANANLPSLQRLLQRKQGSNPSLQATETTGGEIYQ